jgi:segregation and condensation protein B
METQELKRIVEALIFAADEPLSGDRLAETLELENGFDPEALIAELNRDYQESGRAFAIRKVAGGYQIVTQQNYASWIRKLYLGRQKNRLSHAALETLALIAFKQPISRVDIAQIRGVNSDAVIGTLLERKLITISGRSETVGRPLLYSTTPEFLKYFGINDIADLPKPREIEELFSKEGMPEELLQALSQTDAQLSLPINGESEKPASPEEIESKVDINEEVVTHLAEKENHGESANSSAPAKAGENEIAWISLQNATNEEAEHFIGTELSVEDLIETSHDLQSFGSVAQEVSHHAGAEEITNALSALDVEAEVESLSLATMMAEMSADFVRTDTVIDNHEALTPGAFVADVEEIIEIAAASPSTEVQVVEMNDMGMSAAESPPALQNGRDEEIDGWLADEFSQDEIAEPDFLRKGENFFLEEVRQPAANSALTLDPEGTCPEPIVVSTPELVISTEPVVQAREPELEDETFGDLKIDGIILPVADLKREGFHQGLAVDGSAPGEALVGQARESPRVASESNSPATLRERVAGWMRRAFNKLMALIGARV